MLEYGTCCGCLPLREECIIFGLVDLIAQLPHIAICAEVDGDIFVMDLIEIIIGTFISVLLIYGTIMESVRCLWIWIFVHIIRTIFFGVGLVYFVFKRLAHIAIDNYAAETQEEIEDVQLDIMIGLTSINIGIYIFLIVIVYRYICQFFDDETAECKKSDDEHKENAQVQIQV